MTQSAPAKPAVGVIGLGNLGSAIGRRLVACGYDVAGFDLDARTRAAWHDSTGLEAAETMREGGPERVEPVFVAVRTPEQARSVLAWIAEASQGPSHTCYVVTTLDPGSAQGLASFDGGVLRVIELPVSGGYVGALEGTLTVMAAGPFRPEDREFLLATIAGKVVRFDDFGGPTIAKLLNNLLCAYNARAFAEVILMAEPLGVDPGDLYEVILDASGGSWIARGYREMIDETLAKDVGLVRGHIGGLPSIDLSEDTELVRRLGAARRLLPPSGETPRSARPVA